MTRQYCAGWDPFGVCQAEVCATGYMGEPLCAGHAEVSETTFTCDPLAAMGAAILTARAYLSVGDHLAAERALELGLAIYDARKAGVTW